MLLLLFTPFPHPHMFLSAVPSDWRDYGAASQRLAGPLWGAEANWWRHDRGKCSSAHSL